MYRYGAITHIYQLNFKDFFFSGLYRKQISAKEEFFEKIISKKRKLIKHLRIFLSLKIFFTKDFL